jgi:hypothetical protein
MFFISLKQPDQVLVCLRSFLSRFLFFPLRVLTSDFIKEAHFSFPFFLKALPSAFMKNIIGFFFLQTADTVYF